LAFWIVHSGAAQPEGLVPAGPVAELRSLRIPMQYQVGGAPRTAPIQSGPGLPTEGAAIPAVPPEVALPAAQVLAEASHGVAAAVRNR
jgi:hypothetical protein